MQGKKSRLAPASPQNMLPAALAAGLALTIVRWAGLRMCKALCTGVRLPLHARTGHWADPGECARSLSATAAPGQARAAEEKNAMGCDSPSSSSEAGGIPTAKHGLIVVPASTDMYAPKSTLVCHPRRLCLK